MKDKGNEVTVYVLLLYVYMLYSQMFLHEGTNTQISFTRPPRPIEHISRSKQDMLWLHVFRIKCPIFSVLAALLCVFPSDHLFHWYCPTVLLMSLSLCCSFFFFLSQHRVFGDLCCLWRQAVARAVRGSTWFCSGSGAGQTRRPLRLRPKSRTCSSGTDKGLHSLWGRRGCRGGGC